MAGQNKCFEHAKYDWVLFVSNDVILLAGAINILDLHKDNFCQVMPNLMGEKLLSFRWPGYGGQGKDYCPSICYLMHKSLWQTVGKFDESLGSSHEDIDFGIRLRKIGGHIERNTFTRGFHLQNQTLSKTLKNKRKVFHDARVMVIKKHYKGLDRWTRLLAVNMIDSAMKMGSKIMP